MPLSGNPVDSQAAILSSHQTKVSLR